MTQISRTPLARTPLAAAILLLLSSGALADDSTTDAAAVDYTAATKLAAADAVERSRRSRVLDTVTVTATRTEESVQDVAATATVLDREQMDRELVRDLNDLLRYEPGISVSNGFGRFGIGDIRIRGLGGNRVRIETDGIAVPDAFDIGAFSDANRNFVDMDTLKRVEIVRGPASSLYGSDALGGVVTFVTKDPEDYLDAGQRRYVGAKLAYESDWDGAFAGATLAQGGERWSGMLVLGASSGSEMDNKGKNSSEGPLRTKPNPQDRDSRSLLAKLVFAPSQVQRFRLTAEGYEDEADSTVLNMLGVSPRTGATTLSLDAEDLQDRTRIALAHEHDALGWVLADRMDWHVFRQDSNTTQDTFEEQVSAAGVAVRRERRFTFDQEVIGAEAQFHKEFVAGSTLHHITWGVELTETDIAQERDGRAIDHASGTSSPVVSPDVFPVRDFPLSTVRNAGFFVQDQIELADGRLRLIPGLRVDRFALRPELDPIYAEDNPDIQPADISETSVSPKLGVVYKFSDDWSVFGSFARGFRSPPYNDVNMGFTNLQHGYATLPNPDLKPETSKGLELGLRYDGAAVEASLAAFENRYDDFIESLVVVSRPPATPIIHFQSLNIAEAKIRGMELKAGVDFGAWSPALEGWSLRAAAAWQHGEDEVEDLPLTSVDPARAVLGIGYAADHWGVELASRFARRKTRLADPEQFAPPGYGVFDLMAHWTPRAGVTIDAGIFNLTDKTWWDWADVAGLTTDSPVLARNTRPGRSLSASVRLDW